MRRRKRWMRREEEGAVGSGKRWEWEDAEAWDTWISLNVFLFSFFLSLHLSFSFLFFRSFFSYI